MPDAATYIGIEAAAPRGQIAVRADLSDAVAAAAIAGATGLAVPGALSVAADGESRAIWMSPDELLVHVPADRTAATLAALEQALAGHHHMVLDVSDARTVARLTGQRVGEVLAKSAPCDLSDRACPPGTARRTHLAGLAVALWRLEPEVWEIACFRSYAHHLRAWLDTAAAEGAEIG